MIKRAIGNYKIIAGAAIFAVLVVHFAWQFSFIQSENVRNAETAVKAISPTGQPGQSELKAETKPNNQPVEVKPENQVAKVKPTDETENSDETDAPKTAQTAAYRSPVIKPVMSSPVNKNAAKKSSAESKAERLRRAEKLLTGL